MHGVYTVPTLAYIEGLARNQTEDAMNRNDELGDGADIRGERSGGTDGEKLEADGLEDQGGAGAREDDGATDGRKIRADALRDGDSNDDDARE